MTIHVCCDADGCDARSDIDLDRDYDYVDILATTPGWWYQGHTTTGDDRVDLCPHHAPRLAAPERDITWNSLPDPPHYVVEAEANDRWLRRRLHDFAAHISAAGADLDIDTLIAAAHWRDIKDGPVHGSTSNPHLLEHRNGACIDCGWHEELGQRGPHA